MKIFATAEQALEYADGRSVLAIVVDGESATVYEPGDALPHCLRPQSATEATEWL